MLNEESEGNVVAFYSEFSGESGSAEYVRVCEWGVTFGAYEGWVMFSFASVDMHSPRHLQRVPLGSVGCRRVRVDCVVRSCGSGVV